MIFEAMSITEPGERLFIKFNVIDFSLIINLIIIFNKVVEHDMPRHWQKKHPTSGKELIKKLCINALFHY